MDPNANLEEQLDLAEQLLDVDQLVDSDDLMDKSERLATLVQDLHEWLKGGGFLPADWSRP